MSTKRFLDALESSSSSSDEEEVPKEVTKRPKKQLTIKDLEECGYKDRPSILFVPEPRSETDNLVHHDWSDGWAHRVAEMSREETTEEREATSLALTEGVEEVAEFVMKRMEHAEELRQERKKEQQKLTKNRRLTFNQKEKAKRNSGRANSSKNFVEEEKRIGRNLGVYSGFDS